MSRELENTSFFPSLLRLKGMFLREQPLIFKRVTKHQVFLPLVYLVLLVLLVLPTP
jgi:hypothetical protein